MATRERLICPSSALQDGGDGVRFEVNAAEGAVAAFAVRHAGVPRAFLNRCAHVPVELDWQPGKFFDLTGQYLICSMHGAHYDPHSGRCVMGPCRGRHLTRIAVTEREGNIYLQEGEHGERET